MHGFAKVQIIPDTTILFLSAHQIPGNGFCYRISTKFFVR